MAQTSLTVGARQTILGFPFNPWLGVPKHCSPLVAARPVVKKHQSPPPLVTGFSHVQENTCNHLKTGVKAEARKRQNSPHYGCEMVQNSLTGPEKARPTILDHLPAIVTLFETGCCGPMIE